MGGGPEVPAVQKGEMQFVILSGNPSGVAPKLVVKDPASGVDTTYVPVYYVDQLLKQYFYMGATWNGTTNTWAFTSQRAQ